MSNRIVLKTKQAFGSVTSLINRSKMNSWYSQKKLYDSIILSSLTYNIGIWGLRYEDIIEKAQVGFFKNLLWLPRNTLNYIIRLETDTVKVSFLILKAALSWLFKLKSMSDQRLPKICFNRLKQLSDTSPIKYNWVTQLKTYFIVTESLDLWNTCLGDNVYNKSKLTADLLEKYKNILLNQDLNRLANSSSLLVATSFSYEKLPFYLTLNCPTYLVRIIAQLRLGTKNYIKLSDRTNIHKIQPIELCTICNMNQEETLSHLFFECPFYRHLRVNYLQGINSLDDLAVVLDSGSQEALSSVGGFVTSMLRVRSFLLNE